MTMIQAQTWKGSSFTIERAEGRSPGTTILRLRGHFTARDMYGSLTPDALIAMFDFQPAAESGAPGLNSPALNIIDLTDVPYMDSSGLGVIVRQYVRCKSKGIPLIVAGAGPRILELFQMTNVDGLIPTAASVEEAETR